VEAEDTGFRAEADACPQEKSTGEAHGRGPRERHVHKVHVHGMHAYVIRVDTENLRHTSDHLGCQEGALAHSQVTPYKR
jgi:hypothetical protein